MGIAEFDCIVVGAGLVGHGARGAARRQGNPVKALALPGLLLALAACQSTPPDGSASPGQSRDRAADRAGFGAAGVTRRAAPENHPGPRRRHWPVETRPLRTPRQRPTEICPTRGRPSFADIANRPGMTAEGFAAWLRDGHNYPVEMGFYLEPRQVDALAAYIIRLRAGR